MAFFSFRAKTLEGKKKRGKVEAPDRMSAIQELRRRGLYCYRIWETEGGRRTGGLKAESILLFVRQMEAMLRAGMTAERALETEIQASPDPQMRKVLSSVYENIKRGCTMSEAMRMQGRAFPPLLCCAAEAGESSGTLGAMMGSMAKHFEREYAIRKKLRTIMIYPCILMAVTLAALVFLLTAAVPQFAAFYEGTELPRSTRLLIGLSELLRAHGFAAGFGIFAAGALCAWMLGASTVKRRMHRYCLGIPALGRLLRVVYTARFASALAVLNKSGMDILDCLSAAAQVTGNTYVEEKVREAALAVWQGRTLADSLGQLNIFHSMLISMVMVGEESGTLDSMLASAGDFFDREAENGCSGLIAVLEPAVILFMGAVVGLTVLAVMTPMFQMYSQIL